MTTGRTRRSFITWLTRLGKNEPFDMGEYKVDEVSAEEAYDKAVKSAGAVLPVRDSIDARVLRI